MEVPHSTSSFSSDGFLQKFLWFLWSGWLVSHHHGDWNLRLPHRLLIGWAASSLLVQDILWGGGRPSFTQSHPNAAPVVASGSDQVMEMHEKIHSWRGSSIYIWMTYVLQMSEDGLKPAEHCQHCTTTLVMWCFLQLMLIKVLIVFTNESLLCLTLFFHDFNLK